MDIKDLCDNQAESTVIASLIYHPEFIHHTPYLHERFFHNMECSCIFWAIRMLSAEGITKIDGVNLSSMLNSNKAVMKNIQKYNLPNMNEYIDSCLAIKRDTIEEYKLSVKRVCELAFKRDFYKKAETWQQKCFDNEFNLDQMSNMVYKEINTLTSTYMTDGEITVFGDKIDSIYEKIKSKKDRGESYGLPSFFPTVNRFFTYEETELIVICSRMKNGKSWLAMIEALHKAMNGVPTFIQDSEMSDENFYIRVIAYLSGISVQRIKNEKLTDEEEKIIAQTNEQIKKLPLYHNYDPYMTKEKFYSICAQKKNEMGLKFVVWDYIKADDSILDPAERSAYMSGMTNFLKNIIAGDLKMSVLAFAQLNRKNEVAECDGIEKYCSVSVRWERKTDEEILKDGKECGTHKFRVALNRLGEQHMSEDEYIDMMFSQVRVGITEAKQHENNSPF